MDAVTPAWVPGNPHDRSIIGFRIRHGSSRGPMSPSAYYRLRAAGRGPRETYISAGRIIITPAAEKAWDKARANPSTTEQRLIEKSKAFRLDRAKKAGKAALDSDNHVSKTRRRER